MPVIVDVEGLKVTIENNAGEASFTDRATWPANAHAPTVLGFKLGPKFFDLSEGDRRIKFASMAHALTGLGKGPRAGDPAAVVTDSSGRMIRSIAYADSVAMGESERYRARMLAGDDGASSCAMFSRSLLKMIGATTASFANPYVDGKVFDELDQTAKFANVRGTPGTTEKWPKPGGGYYLDSSGNPIQRLKMPAIGDVVVVANDSWQHAHTFVIVEDNSEPDEMAGALVRKDRDGVTRAHITRWYVVAQGGQAAEKPIKYPNDGSCMGSNQRTHTLDPDTWFWDNYGGADANKNPMPRRVKYWIDINELAPFTDRKAIVEPDRKMWW